MEKVETLQPQVGVDNANYLDLFWFSFQPDFWAETALVTQVNDLRLETRQWIANPVDSSGTLSSVQNHGIFLGHLTGLSLKATKLHWFHPFFRR